MKLNGDKLLADLEGRVEALFNQIDTDVDNQSYDHISARKIEIDSIRKVIRLINLGDYTINKDK